MIKTVFYLLLMFSVIACNNADVKEDHAAHEHSAAEKYTCPMHPNVISDTPSTCPVCGMDLVKVKNSTSSTASSNSLMLTNSQLKLANVTTEKVNKTSIGQSVVINGRLATNQENSQTISSRAAGRIEKLYVKETGVAIKKGQPLYTLYSEMLLTLQQEYLLAREQYETLKENELRYKSFLDAARKKLILYGLTASQIEQLKDRSSLQASITFLAASSGIITEINSSEGQYIAEGATLYKIEDLSTLWAEAELYPTETSLVKIGDKIKISIGSSQTLEGTITFLSPELRANSQIVVMRASVRNAKGELKPGQQIQVYLTHSSKEAINVPVDAVVRNGKGAHVYIQDGQNNFRPQMVKTGIENFDKVEITEGINEGDTVVVSGAYLLYSEIVLKKGIDPMAGHGH